MAQPLVVCVTGASGFIASHIVPIRLLQEIFYLFTCSSELFGLFCFALGLLSIVTIFSPCLSEKMGNLAPWPCHQVKQLLEKGHSVRGTVRDALDLRKTEHLMLAESDDHHEPFMNHP